MLGIKDNRYSLLESDDEYFLAIAEQDKKYFKASNKNIAVHPTILLNNSYSISRCI